MTDERMLPSDGDIAALLGGGARSAKGLVPGNIPGDRTFTSNVPRYLLRGAGGSGSFGRMPHTVTTFQLPDAALALLREVGTVSGPDAWEERLAEAEGLIVLLTVKVDAALLERAPKLRIAAIAVV